MAIICPDRPLFPAPILSSRALGPNRLDCAASFCCDRRVNAVSVLALVLFSSLIVDHSLAGSATWAQNPTSGDWNTAANWTPATVPNAPDDVATFGISNITAVTVSMGVELNSVVFNPGASAFSITPGSDSGSIALIISGAGIINNSGVTQNFAVSSSPRATQSFTGSATAGDSVQYTVSGGDPSYGFGFDFYDNTMAATATFVINGGTDAAHRQAGHVSFWDDSTAEKATITLNGGHKGAYGGNADFYENSAASRACFSVNGATEKSASGGLLRFQGTTTADRAVIMCLGSDISGPGDLYFQDSATAANATLIAKGGKALGGRIIFDAIGTPTGGTARVKLFGNGQLINLHSAGSPLEIGSLEGDGIVSLGEGILEVGNNGRDTTFSGVIQERVAIGLPASAGRGMTLRKTGSPTPS